MKRACTVLFFTGISAQLFAQNEIRPEGDKLIWILLIVIAFIIFIYLNGRIKRPKKVFSLRQLFQVSRVKIELEKNKLYYPDFLSLKVKNSGNLDIDLDKPMLVFDNFWLRRNFRINGMNNRTFYPLYLEKGKIHTLEIDLNQFYRHDKRLKRYPKIRIKLFDIKNRKLGSKSIFIRKTLFKF